MSMRKIKIKFCIRCVDIDDMKKLALTIIISVAGVALSAEEYTIQTISTLKESSITPAFEKKVQKSALLVTKKKEGSCNVVTVGRYDNAKKARADLAKAKAVAKDAFVRPVTRSVPNACATSVAEKKGEKTAKANGVATVTVSGKVDAVAEKPKNAVSAETPKEAVKTVVAPAFEPSASKVASVPVEKAESSEGMNRTAVFIYDRNLARKSDIHEAIEYYKNSPYHTFKPIAMQR